MRYAIILKDISTQNTNDQDLWSGAVKPACIGNYPLTDNFGSDNLKQVIRTAYLTAGERCFGLMKSFFTNPQTLPVGTFCVGDSVGNPSTIAGTISKHNCYHDQPEVQIPCSSEEAEYEETII